MTFETTASDVLWYTWSDSASATTYINDPWWNWNTNTTGTASSATWNQWQIRQDRWEIRQEYRPLVDREPARPRVYARPKEDIELARRKGEQLLMEHLTPEQKAMYRRLKKFRVISSEGKVYELDATKQWHNVFELDDKGKRVNEFCIYQTGQGPLPDNHLGQKLLLEADEAEFKRIANMTQLQYAAG